MILVVCGIVLSLCLTTGQLRLSVTMIKDFQFITKPFFYRREFSGCNRCIYFCGYWVNPKIAGDNGRPNFF